MLQIDTAMSMLAVTVCTVPAIGQASHAQHSSTAPMNLQAAIQREGKGWDALSKLFRVSMY